MTRLEDYRTKVGGNTFSQILQTFEMANKRVYSECVVSHTDNDHGLKGQFRMAVSIVLGYKVNENKTWCDLYATTEPHFTRLLRDRQFPDERTLKGVLLT